MKRGIGRGFAWNLNNTMRRQAFFPAKFTVIPQTPSAMAFAAA